MDRPSARLLRLARTLRRLRRRPRRTATEIALIEAHLWARRLGTGPYVRGFKGVSLLPPTRAVLYPPEGGAARLSEDIEALRSLARFWHEVSASLWPQRS